MSFLKNYEEYAKEITDAPYIFHETMALILAGTILGNKVWCQCGHKRLYTNIWCLLLANSSSFHKSTALGIATHVLYHVDPTKLLPTEFTQERLCEMLSENSTGLFSIDEFGGFMGYLDKDYMQGTKQFITSLYSLPLEYSRVTKVKTVVLREISVSIAAASTLDWLIGAIKESDIRGGFLPRFIIIPAYIKEKSLAKQPPEDVGKRNIIVQDLRKMWNIETGACIFTEVDKIYEEWYEGFSTRYNVGGGLDAFYARLQEYTLKFAMIYNICNHENDKVIREDSLLLAINKVETLAEMLKTLGKNELILHQGEKNRSQILSMIRHAGKEGVSREDILRKFGKLSAKGLSFYMETLREKGDIDEVVIKTGHRPKTFYKMRTDDVTDKYKELMEQKKETKIVDATAS